MIVRPDSRHREMIILRDLKIQAVLRTKISPDKINEGNSSKKPVPNLGSGAFKSQKNYSRQRNQHPDFFYPVSGYDVFIIENENHERKKLNCYY